jgi:DNA-binding response OmpR family regulator
MPQEVREMGNESVRILVVDDEVPICELLAEFLALQGYDVTTATSGEDALSRFREWRPHLVILDIRMPGMSGLEVLGRIREMDTNAGVIMLSAFGDASTIEEALQVGADYYMEKPMELERLLNLLDSWRQRTPE